MPPSLLPTDPRARPHRRAALAVLRVSALPPELERQLGVGGLSSATDTGVDATHVPCLGVESTATGRLLVVCCCSIRPPTPQVPRNDRPQSGCALWHRRLVVVVGRCPDHNRRAARGSSGTQSGSPRCPRPLRRLWVLGWSTKIAKIIGIGDLALILELMNRPATIILP